MDLRNNNQTDAFFSQFSYDFHFLWMMNHDFDVLVVNNIMKRRFVKKQDYIDESTIISNNESLLIKIYNIMIIKVDTSIEKNSMILLNMIYMLDFIINIIVNRILKDKELHFDIQHWYLYQNNSAVFLMLRIEAHYVLKTNRLSEKMIVFATFIRVIFTHDWYQLFAHANNEIIQYLATAVEGIKLTDKKSVFKINQCEEYTLFKGNKIVSRFITKSETSKKLFFCIIYDLIVINTTINKNW